MPFPNVATQFKPGNGGGPGRPRVKPITDRMRVKLETAQAKKIIADAVVDQWLNMIKKGDSTALKELLNRIEGPTPLTVEGSVQHDYTNANLPAILAALGYERRAIGSFASPIESSGISSSIESGTVDSGASSGSDQPEVPGVHGGHRANGIASHDPDGST